MLDLLLAAGCDPTAAAAANGTSGLHLAAQYGRLEVVRKLLALGVDPAGGPGAVRRAPG